MDASPRSRIRISDGIAWVREILEPVSTRMTYRDECVMALTWESVARSEGLEPQPSDPLIYTGTLMASSSVWDLPKCCSAVRSSCQHLASP